ncbi:N-acyl homoserine lactonase [Burkholderia ubonensis]|uniref:N-acyl homoserine lactonase n=1 Tax=Burkholderia ubonensis TaxID=101571 RepID=UPI000A9BAFAA|nr:N-acyl homoserine lactonase [Burkholderia ubonensis]
MKKTIFRRLLILATSLSIAACVSPPLQNSGITAAPASQNIDVRSILATKGDEVATQLTNRYNSTVHDCGNPGRAAFLCSGVMMRGTETNPNFLPWDPSPSSVLNGGVSFSWLRTDDNFPGFAYGYRNGLIFYPVLATPPEKNSNIEILCSFTTDGDTFDRSMKGCGANWRELTASTPCDFQGISTAQQWIIHYNGGTNKYTHQCGWDVREGIANQADRFYQSVLARQLINNNDWLIHNELRLATWRSGTGATLPIQAFFYINGNSDGLRGARNDQTRYYQLYSEIVPIIRVTLPSTRDEKAAFIYDQRDQSSGTMGTDQDSR